jgi:hypothetical protein
MTPNTQPVPMSELERCQKANLRLFYWDRQGDPKDDWKKATGKQWNRRDLVDDFSHYDPTRHNVGTITGIELTPGRFLCDVDIDWVPPRELFGLLPASEFVFGRPSKPISHLFFTTPERLRSVKEYKDVDGKKFLELFGGDFSQYTMVPPSLRTPDEPLAFYNGAHTVVTHIELDELYRHLRNYAIAVVLYRNFKQGGVLHAARLPLAGFLLKEGLSEEDVAAIGRAVILATGNDVKDWETALKTTIERIKAGEKVSGGSKLAEQLGDVGKKVIATIKKFIGNSEFIVNEHGKILADCTENIRTAIDRLEVRLCFDEFSEQMWFQQDGSEPRVVDDNNPHPAAIQD